MRALITGVTGFVGSHLAEYLLGRGDVEVFGTIRWRSRRENIEGVQDKIHLVECDLRDSTAVNSVVATVKPDLIFHLAAQSFVPTSWVMPFETMYTNVLGQVNLFEAVRQAGISPRIQIACSSEEYGLVNNDELPITEENVLRPLSPYAVSKVAQDMLGYQYWMSYQMRIIRTRTFNHTGPRRGEVFVTSNFAKQVAEIEKGLREPVVMVGNLEARRDFTDVRDVVRGYWLALEKGIPGEVYHISRGETNTIQAVLDILTNLARVKVKVKQDPARMRPSDVPVLLGDSSKFRQQTGWSPQYSLETTMSDLLDYWRWRLGVTTI